MTGLEWTLFITPTGGLLLGLFSYWIATRPEKRKKRPTE